MKFRMIAISAFSIIALTGCDDGVRSGVVSDNIPDESVTINTLDEPTAYEPANPEEFLDSLRATYHSSAAWKFRGRYRAEYDYLGSNSKWQDFAMAVDTTGAFRIETEIIRVVSDSEQIILVNLIDQSYALFPAPPSPSGQGLAIHAGPVPGMFRFLPALEPWLMGLDEKQIEWTPVEQAYEFNTTNGDGVTATVSEEGLFQKLVLYDEARFVFIVEEQESSPEFETDLFEIVLPKTGTDISDQLKLQRNLDDQYSLIDTPAPDFSADYLDGNHDDLFVLSEQKGKVVLIDFWAMWCPPCLEGLPSLNNFHEIVADENTIILAANLDTPEDIESKTLPWLKKKNISVPNIKAYNADWLADYAVDPLPYMVLIGPDGIIRDVYLGSPPSKEKLKAKIQSLILEYETRQTDSEN